MVYWPLDQRKQKNIINIISVLIVLMVVLFVDVPKAEAKTIDVKTGVSIGIASSENNIEEVILIKTPTPRMSVRDIEERASEYGYRITPEIREMLAKVVYAEANVKGCGKTEASKVVWTILNRLDSGVAWFGDNIVDIITKPYQYTYKENTPVTEENLWIVDDVLERWLLEKAGMPNVGRTIPSNIIAFRSNDTGTSNNYFYYDKGINKGEMILLEENLPSPYAS